MYIYTYSHINTNILQYPGITLYNIGLYFMSCLCMIGIYIYILVSHTHCIAVNDDMTFQMFGQLIGIVYRRISDFARHFKLTVTSLMSHVCDI